MRKKMFKTLLSKSQNTGRYMKFFSKMCVSKITNTQNKYLFCVLNGKPCQKIYKRLGYSEIFSSKLN